MKIRTSLILIALFSAIGADMAAGQQIQYNGSVQYSSGSYYFTDRTSSFYFNNGFGLSGNRVSLYLNVPFITQNTPWMSYSSASTGPLPTGGPRSGMVSGDGGSGGGSGSGGHGHGRMGGEIDPGSTDSVNFTETHFGDPSLNGQVKLYSSGFGRTSISGSFGVKFPLTDPGSGFGTGAWDLGAGLSWSQQISRTLLFMAGGSYWWLGDMDDLDLNNILTYSAAIGRSFNGGKLLATANLFGSTQVIEGIDPPVNAGAGISFQATPSIFLNTNLLFGLTESAADYSFGFGWSVKL